jgi:membrane-associated PAP2 superfamily phosphatase
VRLTVTPARPRHDLVLTLGALAALLLWDASGLDLVVSHWFGDLNGFVWREAWWARDLLHNGGRSLAAVVLVAGLAHVWWPRAAGPSTPRRAERLRWTVVVLVSLILVPALKRLSDTSCPWDLAEFGGVAATVSHWRFGVGDGGPGHCFPSGHAVAAFQFFGLYFLWREHRPGLARAWLLVIAITGVLFGFAQLVRGAHFVSHTLWSAWLCWVIAATVAAWPRGGARAAARRGGRVIRRAVGQAFGRPREVSSPAAAALHPALAAGLPRSAPGAAHPRRRGGAR